MVVVFMIKPVEVPYILVRSLFQDDAVFHVCCSDNDVRIMQNNYASYDDLAHSDDGFSVYNN